MHRANPESVFIPKVEIIAIEDRIEDIEKQEDKEQSEDEPQVQAEFDINNHHHSYNAAVAKWRTRELHQNNLVYLPSLTLTQTREYIYFTLSSPDMSVCLSDEGKRKYAMKWKAGMD